MISKCFVGVNARVLGVGTRGRCFFDRKAVRYSGPEPESRSRAPSRGKIPGGCFSIRIFVPAISAFFIREARRLA